MSEPEQFGFQPEGVDGLKAQPRWFELPFLLLFRPGRFFVRWGIHANIIWVVLAAWVIGTAASINSVLNRLRHESDFLGFRIDSWFTVWLIVIGLGIVRGLLFSYGLGGLWTWLRLRICGIRGNEWKRSTRIYCFSHLLEQIASLSALFYFSIRYGSVTAFLAEPVGLVNLLAGLAMLCTPLIGYRGVRGCYILHRSWSIALFLVLPMVWRLGTVLIILVALLGLKATSPTILTEYKDDVFRFNFPSNWRVLVDEPSDEYSIAQIQICSEQSQASVLFRILRRDGIDPNEHDLAVVKDLGYSVLEKKVHPHARIGAFNGYGEEFILDKDGQGFTMFQLVCGFDQDHGLLVRHMEKEGEGDWSRRALQQIVDSLQIYSADMVPADIQNPKLVSRDWFKCSAPINWSEGIESHEQFEAIEFRAFGQTYFKIIIYNRPGNGGIDKELSALLENGMHREKMLSSTPLRTWLGFNGAGVSGTIWMPLRGVHDFWAIFVPLEDGRVLGIKKYQSKSSSHLTDDGFNLIESTLEFLLETAADTQPADP